MPRDPEPLAPVLVLGIGNPILADDGVGLEILERLRVELGADPRVELVDGGTQGIALLGRLEGRRALLLLDAVRLHAAPGTVHVVRDPQRVRAPRGIGGHESNASELLASASLIGVLPPTVDLVGVEPAELRTRLGVSRTVRHALRMATAAAHDLVRGYLTELATEESACTS